MLTALIIRIVDFSRRFAVIVLLAALGLSLWLGWYAANNFKINTDINQLLSSDLDWRKREKALEHAFPNKTDLIIVVLDGDTPDIADSAAAALTQKLGTMTDHFSFVERPDALPFFRKNGLLFLSKDELAQTLNQMVEAQPIMGALSADPSLRGFFGTIAVMAQGVAHGATTYDRLDKAFDTIADAIEAALAGQDQPLSWQAMMPDQKPSLRETRKYILAKPILDFSDLQPGAAASNALRDVVKKLQLTPERGVHVRLTGSVALNDEEFASVASGTSLATILSAVLVFVLLLLAMRSLRIVLPIILTLAVGLIATTAFALATVGSLNLISVAFAVMFIGIAVDFGIQFGVRYRDQHHLEPNYAYAMTNTARVIAVPLSMAAGSTALGFLAFIPTAYRGVSELGWIAGGGMLIAFALNITLLPALLTLTHPPAEKEAIGFDWAAPADRFIVKYRRGILWGALATALIGTVITMQLRFDFDPLDLKDPHTESVSTLLDAMKDPDFNTYTIEMLRPSLQDAQNLAGQLEKLPQVDHVMTLTSFVPEDQDAKLAMIGDTNMLLGPSLNLPAVPAATNQQNMDALQKTADALQPIQNHPSAARLRKDLLAVIEKHDPDLLALLTKNIVNVMHTKLDAMKLALSAEHVTAAMIPEELKRDWVTTNGEYLLDVYPKGDARNHKALIAFTDAVRQIAPDATGAPISIRESGKTVTSAFIHAGVYALIAIGLLSLLILRRIRDVLIMLAPLVLAGILTLATITLVGLPLNFANIIALPLLLSLGVSYAIYFMSYWRSGMANPLQSSMARAVLFSAGTVLVAFGSLAISSHPGTSGMGKLLTVALIYSLLSTFFILPALCGSPKSDKE